MEAVSTSEMSVTNYQLTVHQCTVCSSIIFHYDMFRPFTWSPTGGGRQ